MGDIPLGKSEPSLKDMLLKRINNRPVALLLPGHSIKELEKRKNEFTGFNWCWAGLNQFWHLEHIFPVEIAIYLDPGWTNFFKDELVNFTKRGVLITGNTSIPNKYHYDCNWLPKHGTSSMNTLYALLWLMIRKKVKKVILFGADGYSETEDPYFGNWELTTHREQEYHIRETKFLNDTFPINRGVTEILNCSPNSHYTAFKKIGYDTLLSDWRE